MQHNRAFFGILTTALLCSVAALSQTTPALPTIDHKEAAKHITHKVQAVYPAIARSAHISGMVAIKAGVNPEGKVETVQVVSGAPLLRQSAIEAVRGYEFSPFLVDGKPAYVWAEVWVSF